MDYEKAYKEALERAREIHNEHRAQCFDVMVKVFPELKENETEKIREEIVDYLKKFIPHHDYDLVTKSKQWIAWLEKQGEQPTDMTEQKFHKGDWVVREYTKDIIKINQVVEVKLVDNENFGYTLDDGTYFSGYWERFYHLWTIQDAKDGDVLALNDEVFIYAHRKQLYSIAVAHCFVDSDGGFYFDGEFGHTEKGNSILPATKEQRDLLFQKMKESGYEWDAEKKELTHIDARENLTLDGDLMEADCMVVEQKSSWSKEDEEVFHCLEYTVKHYYDDKDTISKCCSWLNSLKERIKEK